MPLPSSPEWLPPPYNVLYHAQCTSPLQSTRPSIPRAVQGTLSGHLPLQCTLSCTLCNTQHTTHIAWLPPPCSVFCIALPRAVHGSLSGHLPLAMYLTVHCVQYTVWLPPPCNVLCIYITVNCPPCQCLPPHLQCTLHCPTPPHLHCTQCTAHFDTIQYNILSSL